MKIVFFGSDDFALMHLESLFRSPFQLVACVTQPDRPKGRGMEILQSPIKEFVLRHNIPLLQPESLKDPSIIQSLKALDADVFVVVAYGKILTREVLAIPHIFAVNVHGSLLPKYRGAAPINWAVINGEELTGVSVIRMNEKMDAGDVMGQTSTEIDEYATSQDLRAQLAQAGANLLLKVLIDIDNNEYDLVPQNPTEVTFAPKLTKELGQIDWTMPAKQIYNRLRGLKPWPGAYTSYKGKMLKILRAWVVPLQKAGAPGEITDVVKDGFVVATSDGGLLVKEVHLESSKPMSAESFMAGNPLHPGDKLG